MKIVDNLLSTADKIDHGVLTFKTTKQDKDNIKHILKEGFGNNKEPNFTHWVYKNRAGIDHVILWTRLDLGNLREELLFVTDYDYNLLDIDVLEIDIIDPVLNDVEIEEVEDNEISF